MPGPDAMTGAPLRNRYFVQRPGAAAAEAWDPRDRERPPTRDCVYVGGVLEAMERHLDEGGLTFHVTWDVHALPSYGPDVVAVVLGDEAARMPAYAGRVRAVFKCYGTEPFLGVSPLRDRSYASVRAAAHYLRARLERAPGALRRGRGAGRVFDLPLGYYNQLDLPIRDPRDRGADVFFAGSVVQDATRRGLLERTLGTPKALSRTSMLRELHRLAAREPSLVVRTTTTAGFSAVHTADAHSYSEALMDARICLAPRGSSWETFRFFEGLRYGCVVVTEALPSRWFYDGAPVIRVRDWRELGPAVAGVLRDEGTLRGWHERALAWWRDRCSEAAVGRYVAERLTRDAPRPG